MIIDVVLVVLFLGMLLYGYKKGCIRIVAKLVSVVLAFIAAYIFAGTVGEYIANTSMGQKLYVSLEGTVINEIDKIEETSVIATIKNTLNMGEELNVLEKITEVVFTAIGFLVVFVIVRTILYITQRIIEKIFELPVLKMFNKLGGVIAATVLFIIELGIIFAVIKSISTLNIASSAVEVIRSSVIARTIYDHNIISSLILNKFI